MTEVYLSIGSNIDRENNIRSCLHQLQADFPGIFFSRIYETAAVGFDGEPFLNLAAGLETSMDYATLSKHLKAIEDSHQRTRQGQKFSSRTLDIDILLFGDLVLQPDIDLPREEITHYAFVLHPLAEIAPDFIHPELRQSIADIARQSALDNSSLLEIQL